VVFTLALFFVLFAFGSKVSTLFIAMLVVLVVVNFRRRRWILRCRRSASDGSGRAPRLRGRIVHGLLAFVGITHSDGESHVSWMCEKIARLRIFEDEAGKMNLSVVDVGGGILVVSQFTLYGDAAKGNRPSFTEAAPPEKAERLYDEMIRRLRAAAVVPVQAGSFGAEMEVELVNDGPVTILLEK
jgi:D-tyrosyl-tRNA(Tyr) deacylase